MNSKQKNIKASGRSRQRSNEASVLKRSAGFNFVKMSACGLPDFKHAGGIGLIFLGLGGCMALESKPLPAAPVVVSSPVVNDPAPVVAQPVKIAQRVKKPMRPRRTADARAVPKKMASVSPDRLIGLAPGAVRDLLGPPARIENSDLSREWIYASDGCSFRLFFYPNLNTASFRVLKYGSNDGNGGLLDVSDVCIRHLLTARKNATG